MDTYYFDGIYMVKFQRTSSHYCKILWSKMFFITTYGYKSVIRTRLIHLGWTCRIFKKYDIMIIVT